MPPICETHQCAMERISPYTFICRQCEAGEAGGALAGKDGLQSDGRVLLSAEDARGLAWLLARAIREDHEASDADRREARKLLAKLGGDTQ